MPMYNLVEYSDNYSDTSGSLWNFKRDEIINNADVTNDNNASSFKCKASIIGDIIEGINEEKYIKELLNSSCQGVNRLFVLAYDNTGGSNQISVDSYKKYFLPRVKLNNYNIEIDGRNFYDQPVVDSIKQYDEVRKISTGQGDDYTTGCLLDFDYFEKNYKIIAVDLNKQKALDADSRAIQQIIFTGKIKATVANASKSNNLLHS